MKRGTIFTVMILALAPVVALAAGYTLSQTFSANLLQPYYLDVDADGKVACSEYGNPFAGPENSKARIFGSSGSEDLVYVTYKTVDPEWDGSPAPSGTACFGTKAYFAIDGGTGATQANNLAIWNNNGTKASPWRYTLAYPITGGTQNIRAGDIDFDSAGNLFVAHKVEDGFSVFNKDTGAILSGCPLKGLQWGTGETGAWYIVRGIAVSKDGTKVYRCYGAGATGSGLQYWTGSVTGGVASYTQQSEDLLTGDVGNPECIFIDNGGRLWVPIADKKVRVYDTYDNSFLQEFTFSELATTEQVRGIALNSDSTVLYINNDWGDATGKHVLKYTGTPPAAHATPTPTPTPTPTFEPGYTAAHFWTIYE